MFLSCSFLTLILISPDELIARYPLASRSASRLLHLDAQGQYHDHQFTDLLNLLEAGDLLVLNDTKVMKARLKGKRATGGAVEVLVERLQDQFIAHCHIKASNSPKAGAELFIGPDAVKVTVQGRHENLFIVEFFAAYFRRIGCLRSVADSTLL